VCPKEDKEQATMNAMRSVSALSIHKIIIRLEQDGPVFAMLLMIFNSTLGLSNTNGKYK